MQRKLMDVKQKFRFLHRSHPNHLAIGYTFLSTFVYACITLLVKLIPAVPTFQLIQSYNIVLFIVLYPVSQKIKYPTHKDSNALTALLIFRCFVSFLQTLCWFLGALYVSAAETEIIFNLGVFWTTIYTVFIKRSQKFSLVIVLILTLLPLGLLCIGKSQIGDQNNISTSYRMFGIVILIVGSFMNSVIEICQQKLCVDYNVEINNIMMTIYVVSIFCTSIILIFVPSQSVKQLSVDEYIVILLISLFSMVALYSFNMAFKLGEILTISILQLLTVVYGFFFDIFVFNYQIRLFTVLGAFLISSSNLLNLIQKR